jgi:hypothetical protein
MMMHDFPEGNRIGVIDGMPSLVKVGITATDLYSQAIQRKEGMSPILQQSIFETMAKGHRLRSLAWMIGESAIAFLGKYKCVNGNETFAILGSCIFVLVNQPK